MKKSESAALGKYGEKYTAEYLCGKGYEILDLNYHSPYGEVDIIAKKDGVLSFVEVKTRSVGYLYAPVYAVNTSKQTKIVKTAYHYISETGYDWTVSFDVAVLTVDKDKVQEFTYIENAFEVPI